MNNKNVELPSKFPLWFTPALEFPPVSRLIWSSLRRFISFGSYMATANNSSALSIGSEGETCHYMKDFLWRSEYLAYDYAYKNIIALTSVNFIVAIPAILLNTLVIYTVVTRPRLQTNSNILLSCLAGTDLVSVVLIAPLAISVQVKRFLGAGPFCSVEKAHSIAIVFTSLASFFQLVLIATDRYVAIRYSLRYQVIVTRERIRTAQILSVALVVVLGAQEIFVATFYNEGNSYSIYIKILRVFNGLIYSSLVATTMFLYGYILREAQSQKKLRRKQSEQFYEREAKRIQNDNKAVRNLSFILLVLMLTYIPLGVFYIQKGRSNVQPRAMSLLYSWGAVCLLSGSLLNPLVYCWRLKDIQQVFLEILRPKRVPGKLSISKVIEMRRQRELCLPRDTINS